MPSSGDISFVIPVKDDAVRLDVCLKSIRGNDYASGQVDIVVVDNGSRDNSADVGRRHGARVLHAPSESVAQLRNMGAAAARSNVLAFVDADHVLGPRWIRDALADLEDPSVAAVGALCRSPAEGTWVQRGYDRLRGRHVGRGPVDWLGAGNMAIARGPFEQIGGFDTTLVTCEDVDLCKRFRAAGFRLLADDRLVNVHLGDPATLRALFWGELWRGRSNLTVSLRRPITIREVPSAVVPVVQLAGIVTAAALWLFAGPAGVVPAVFASLPMALVPVVRTVRMASCGLTTAKDIVGDVAVAFVYDLGRALALVAFAGHSVRRTGAR